MPQQTMSQMLGKYEVSNLFEDKISASYKIRNEVWSKVQKRLYVASKFIIDDSKSDNIHIGNFRSLSIDKNDNYDASIYLIGDSVVQLHINDNITLITIYNRDIQKREATKSILERMLS